MRVLAFAVASALSSLDVSALAAGGRGASCSSFEDCDTSLACVSGACIPPNEHFETSRPDLAARLACTLQPVAAVNGERRPFDVSVNGEPCAQPIRNAIPLRISTDNVSVTITANVPFGVSPGDIQRVLGDVRVELEGRLAVSNEPRDKRSSPGLILGGIGVIVLGLGTSAVGGLGIAWGSSSHSCSANGGCSAPPYELAGVGVAGAVIGAAAIVGGIYMIVVGAKARSTR